PILPPSPRCRPIWRSPTPTRPTTWRSWNMCAWRCCWCSANASQPTRLRTNPPPHCTEGEPMYISKQEYARRRKVLMAQMEPDSIAILPAAPVHIRNRDVEHQYRQDSDFQYLTGFPEPEAVAVLIPGREHGEYVLFCREKDPERELWDGYRAGQK